MSRPILIILPLVVAFSATSGGAAGGEGKPGVLQNVVGCRAVADDKARLACFDANVAALGAADARGDITVVNREEIARARRSLFGFSLPSFAFLGGAKTKMADIQGDEIKEVNGKIRAVTRNADGGWIITLEDGARWEQTQAMTFGRSPKPGSTAVIRRAALGSFKMSFDGGPAVKARRIG